MSIRRTIGRVAALAAMVAAGTVVMSWLAVPDEAQDAPAKAQLFDGLKYGRKVSTQSAEAQRYFDQGLALLYAFNHDEAIKSFRQAAELDPRCAMAWWGIAIANGPHINNPVVPKENAQAAWEALTKARAAGTNSSAIEEALIEALGNRYADPQPEDRKPLDQAYAAAMREVWRKYPADPDVGAMFAESLMDLRPWDLWQADGTPHPGTEEIVATLDDVIGKAPEHPLALHLYVHALEGSATPEKANAAADKLRTLEPALGHLVHMPSHIDVRTGRWQQAMETNVRAIEADRKYRELAKPMGFYHVYMAHNNHMLCLAAMMRGQSEQAISAINHMVAGMPEQWVKDNAAVADGFTAMPVEVLVRFGRWDDVLAAPEPADYLPIARAMRHCARGVAYAAKGDVTNAEAEQAAFLKAKAALSKDTRFGNNTGADLMAVAEHLLAGELLYRQGKADEGLQVLREAVACEDRLIYDEPPDWIIPVRHALGATLLKEGRAEEAEAVYRADLVKLPENGWSLYGLARSLRLQKKDDEAAQVEARFQNVWKDADVKITSSCYCQPGL